ncbi:hypothetical protein JXB28_01875 [Candidatus Woesearchaeota archaeon]|nr:hypothetical protein [Candidatus Woesearchaeota archaeon]
MTYTTPAMFNARKKPAYDSENGCTAEPSDCTMEKARITGRDKDSGHGKPLPDIPLERLVAPSAEDEFIARIEAGEKDDIYIPPDVIRQSELLSKESEPLPYLPETAPQVVYPENLAQDSIYAALAKVEEPKALGNAHYGASPKLPERKAEEHISSSSWRRDEKNAKGKKLKSKESIRIDN